MPAGVRHVRVVGDDRLATKELDRADGEPGGRREAVVHLLWEGHNVESVVFVALRLSEESKSTLCGTVVDIVKPACPILVHPRLEASTIHVDAVIPLEVEVAALGHAVTIVARELVHADLIGLGLGVDGMDEPGEQSAQHEGSETRHGEAI